MEIENIGNVKIDLLNLLSEYRLILASASPRRKELLKGLDVDFKVMHLDVNENQMGEVKPNKLAEVLSRLKSVNIPDAYIKEDVIVITADTVVICDDHVLGKPKSTNDAIQMLNFLSGKKHEVITGVCFRSNSRMYSFSEKTIVEFKELVLSEINYYIDHYQPFDKAGAYGIQEWIGKVAVKKIEGSYWNVMGLPVQRLYEELLYFLSV